MGRKKLPKIILFMAGQTISLFGSSIVQYAINWHITLVTQSGLMLTIATLCGFLPQLLISLFAGVWADRYNRKTLIILSDSIIAFFTLILAILFSIGYSDMWLLFVISAIRSLATGIQMPAVNAYLTELVPQDKLISVNGLNSSINNGMLLLSPAAAGGLYSLTGMEMIFWVDVATAAVAITLLVSLKTVPRERLTADSRKKMIHDLLEGIRYSRTTRWLKQLLLFNLFFALMVGPVVFLTPLMISRSFGTEPWRLAAHEMTFSAGGIIGGIIIGIIARRIKNPTHMLIVSSAFFGLCTFMMGLSPNFMFYLAVMLPLGISMPFFNASCTTLMQLNISPDFLGRAFGLLTISMTSAMPLSTVFFGPLSDYVSVEILLLITGAAMIVISLSVIRLKDLRYPS